MGRRAVRLKNLDKSYVKLIPRERQWWEYLTLPFTTTYKATRNIVAVCLGRTLAHLIFNPMLPHRPEEDAQLHVNSPNFPDPEHLGDFEVINVTSKPGFFLRVLQNYARKLQSQFPYELPMWLKRAVQNVLSINIIGQQECDKLIERIEKSVKAGHGNIEPSNIYIKGLEYIEPELRQQTLQAINQKLAKHFQLEHFDIEDNRSRLNFFSLETVEHAVLDSVEVAAKGEAEKKPEDRTYVISCVPRSQNYTGWLKQLRTFAEKAQTTYITFNYRGVERSQGVIWTEKDMVNDAVAQAQRLLLMGVKPEKIAFEGECIGGAVATLAAAELYKQGHDVKLFNARSFRSSSRLALYKILPQDGASKLNPLNWLRYAAAGLFLVIGVPLLKLSHWNLNAAEAWDSIPEDAKDFMVIRSAKEGGQHLNVDDSLIPHKGASIYSYVREKLGEKPSTETKDALHEHRFEVNPETGGDPKKRDGHSCARAQLRARGTATHPQGWCDGREYVVGFYQRVWPKAQQHTETLDAEVDAKHELSTPVMTL